MTTILADWYTGQMAADTGAQAGDRQWMGTRKVWHVRGELVGLAGLCEQTEAFLTWYRNGATGDGPKFSDSAALVMDEYGMRLYSGSLKPISILSKRDAIGTGAQAALAAYEAMGWNDPRKAVRIACNYDSGSRPPIRLYALKR
jgi:hypothetical protein